MKNSMALFSLGALLLAAGCQNDPASAGKISLLEERLIKVEQQVEALGKAGPGGRPAAPPINQEEEKAAAEILKAANQAFEALNYDETRTKIAELKAKYPKTRAFRAAKRIEDELNVIGKDAGEMEVEKWFQGETSMASGEATMLVFWEVWCPHCKREVPKLDATYQKYKNKGFNMVGVTKMTRNITEDQVNSFLSENKVTYPIAKEQGTAMSDRFGIKGIPAAAVVKDGKVVWRGHPARVTDAMIDGWVQ